MAVVTPAATQVASIEERTWRATIDTPKGQPYTLALHRERRALDAQGAQIGDKVVLPDIDLTFDEIKTESVTVSGVTLTVAQITAFLVAYFDQKATQLGS